MAAVASVFLAATGGFAPAGLKLVASAATTNAEGAAMRGRYAFVADKTGGLKIFDLMMGYCEGNPWTTGFRTVTLW